MIFIREMVQTIGLGFKACYYNANILDMSYEMFITYLPMLKLQFHHIFWLIFSHFMKFH